MNFLKIISISILFFSATSNFLYSQCHNNISETSESIVLSFVSNSVWSTQRTEVGLSNSSTDNISVLKNSSDTNACESLNEESQSLFEDYDVYYFKVMDKYVVISTLKQPEEPNHFAVGLSFIEVYSSSFERLKGYSF